jgi:hypothetical protein
MNNEEFYAWLEEAGERELREILDAAINRFHELHPNYELLLVPLPLDGDRQSILQQIIRMI